MTCICPTDIAQEIVSAQQTGLRAVEDALRPRAKAAVDAFVNNVIAAAEQGRNSFTPMDPQSLRFLGMSALVADVRTLRCAIFTGMDAAMRSNNLPENVRKHVDFLVVAKRLVEAELKQHNVEVIGWAQGPIPNAAVYSPTIGNAGQRS